MMCTKNLILLGESYFLAFCKFIAQRYKNNQSLVYEPDAESESSEVCQDWLTREECDRWRSCCKSARDCCIDSQIGKAMPDSDGTCPATWDGVSCWPETEAGVLASHSCPSYYIADKLSWLNPHASRLCTKNASWSVNPQFGTEMSDYGDCFYSQTNIDILKASLYVDFIGNGLSIVFLLAAIILILGSRVLRVELYNKTSLRLHFNLFVTVLLMGIFTVAFHVVYYEAFTSLEKENTAPLYYDNAVWCRVLHALTKYFKCSTYMAMFCEGLFLHKRISHVMRMGVPDPMLKYIAITWGVPVVIVLVYSVVRVSLQKNDRCWIDHGLSFIEYIIIIPCILSLLCNLIFIVSIEVMLCTKMRSDTSDRRLEVLRQALRATLSLIPIFGLQFLFIIYRPQGWPPYEIIVAFCTSTQGILVAILYCFATKEARREISSLFQKCSEGRRNDLTTSNSYRSTMYVYSALSSAGSFFVSIGRRMSSHAWSARSSLPDLVYSSRLSDSRQSSLSRTSTRQGGGAILWSGEPAIQSALFTRNRSPALADNNLPTKLAVGGKSTPSPLGPCDTNSPMIMLSANDSSLCSQATSINCEFRTNNDDQDFPLTPLLLQCDNYKVDIENSQRQEILQTTELVQETCGI